MWHAASGIRALGDRRVRLAGAGSPQITRRLKATLTDLELIAAPGAPANHRGATCASATAANAGTAGSRSRRIRARRGSKEHLHRCRVTFGTADVLTGVAKRRRCGAQGFDALVDNAGDGCCDGAVFDPPGGRSETALDPNIASRAARSRWPSCKRSTRALAPFAFIN
jgi:hypothetical protein